VIVESDQSNLSHKFKFAEIGQHLNCVDSLPT